MSLFAVIHGGKVMPRDADGDRDGDEPEPERNFAEERLRHAARLVKAVHAHDVEGAEDAMRAHHSVTADEHEYMTAKEK